LRPSGKQKAESKKQKRQHRDISHQHLGATGSIRALLQLPRFVSMGCRADVPFCFLLFAFCFPAGKTRPAPTDPSALPDLADLPPDLPLDLTLEEHDDFHAS
jgi:hypothetical protein